MSKFTLAISCMFLLVALSARADDKPKSGTQGAEDPHPGDGAFQAGIAIVNAIEAVRQPNKPALTAPSESEVIQQMGAHHGIGYDLPSSKTNKESTDSLTVVKTYKAFEDHFKGDKATQGGKQVQSPGQSTNPPTGTIDAGVVKMHQGHPHDGAATSPPEVGASKRPGLAHAATQAISDPKVAAIASGAKKGNGLKKTAHLTVDRNRNKSSGAAAKATAELQSQGMSDLGNAIRDFGNAQASDSIDSSLKTTSSSGSLASQIRATELKKIRDDGIREREEAERRRQEAIARAAEAQRIADEQYRIKHEQAYRNQLSRWRSGYASPPRPTSSGSSSVSSSTLPDTHSTIVSQQPTPSPSVNTSDDVSRQLQGEYDNIMKSFKGKSSSNRCELACDSGNCCKQP